MKTVSWIASAVAVLAIFSVVNNAFNRRPTEFQREFEATKRQMDDRAKREIRQDQIRRLDAQIDKLSLEREPEDEEFQKRLKIKQDIYKIDGE